MKINFLLIPFLVLATTSCSTLYKSGQTPDDVYYSEAKAKTNAEVKKEVTRTDRRPTRNTDFEERQIRMATYDRRWRNLNDDYDYGYSYNPYRYGYTYGYYYNPYYYPCPVYISNVAISNPKNTTPRMTGLSSYNNTSTTVTTNSKFGTPTRNNTIRAYNTGSTTNSSNRTYTQQKTTPAYQQTTTETNSRSYTPATNTSTNSSSSGSSSPGSISRPARKN